MDVEPAGRQPSTDAGPGNRPRVYAIGDLHLEGGSGKTMDRFGEAWRNHDRKIFEGWDQIGNDEDILILAGDITWATRLREALPDMDRIGAMKGRKIMVRGNHDYWWESVAKLKRTIPKSIIPLDATSVIVDRVAIAGTRGWICPGSESFEEADEKIYEREVGRLRIALETLTREAGYDCLIVVMHYPPANSEGNASGFTDLIDKYHADHCVYGHLHGEWLSTGLTGNRAGTIYHLVSADNVNFAPARII